MNEQALIQRIEKLEADAIVLQTAFFALVWACNSPKLRERWAQYKATVLAAEIQARNHPVGAQLAHSQLAFQQALALLDTVMQGHPPPYALGEVDIAQT